jgi:chromosome segregation ATPase
MGELADPQTIKAASQVLATIDQRHTILEDQDRRLREMEAKVAAAENKLQATLEANAAAELEHAELEGDIARLREEARTAKARLEQETRLAKERLRDVQGRSENIERQNNLALRELEETRREITALKLAMPGGMR